MPPDPSSLACTRVAPLVRILATHLSPLQILLPITAQELRTAVTEKGALQMPLQSSDPRRLLCTLLFIQILHDANLVPRLHGGRWLPSIKLCSVQQHPVKRVSAVNYYQ